MASAGAYTLEVTGLLDESKIRAALAKIQAEINGGTFVGGSSGKNKKNGTSTIVQQTEKDAKKAKKSVEGFTTSTKKARMSLLDVGKKVVAFGAVTSAVQMATAGVSDMVSNVFELDEALTEYKKVSNLSEKGIESMTNKAYELGKTVSKTGTQVIDASTQFKKSGYSDKDSMQLGKIALLYTNIADEEISAGDAANFIVAQMKAFNLQAQDAEHIIGAVNEVSNKFAVSSSDIATNIGKTSAAMATGNVTYEQTIGLTIGQLKQG